MYVRSRGEKEKRSRPMVTGAVAPLADSAQPRSPVSLPPSGLRFVQLHFIAFLDTL